MPKLTQDDVRKAAEQGAHTARQALLAALGAGDLAAKAVVEALGKAKERADEARSQAVDIPNELKDLREKLQPAELKKLVDAYTASAVNLYTYLADQGEQTLEQIKAQPQVKQAVEQVEQAVEAAQKRAESAAADAKVLADDVLGKVTRRTRSVGEKVALEVEDAAEKLAEEIVEVGGEAAHEVRSTARKTANRTAPRKPATTTRSTTTAAVKKTTPNTTK
jgi:heparin binding hemagglutinin HbhA